MTRENHPIYGESKYLLKRWQRYSIFSKSGSWVRSDNPRDNLYDSCSVYLYDYIVVNDTWMNELVYSASTVDSTPSIDRDYVATAGGWIHNENTFRNSPNTNMNNFVYTYDPTLSVVHGHPYYRFPVIYRDDGVYFEVVEGYPRNHYTHKRGYFALERFISYGLVGNTVTSASYRRGKQDSSTTISLTGISDGSDPVQTTQVTNIDLIKSDNVIYH